LASSDVSAQSVPVARFEVLAIDGPAGAARPQFERAVSDALHACIPATAEPGSVDAIIYVRLSARATEAALADDVLDPTTKR
jgi:hypothetical protein